MTSSAQSCPLIAVPLTLACYDQFGQPIGGTATCSISPFLKTNAHFHTSPAPLNQSLSHPYSARCWTTVNVTPDKDWTCLEDSGNSNWRNHRSRHICEYNQRVLIRLLEPSG